MSLGQIAVKMYQAGMAPATAVGPEPIGDEELHRDGDHGEEHNGRAIPLQAQRAQAKDKPPRIASASTPVQGTW
jgi:hypothetical protein